MPAADDYHFCALCYSESINRVASALPLHMAQAVRNSAEDHIAARGDGESSRHDRHVRRCAGKDCTMTLLPAERGSRCKGCAEVQHPARRLPRERPSPGGRSRAGHH